MDSKRFIYFPRATEQRRDPRIIYTDGKLSFSGEYRGTENEKDFQEGKFALYDGRRCRTYSDALWKECTEWMERKARLHEDFLNLMKMVRK